MRVKLRHRYFAYALGTATAAGCLVAALWVPSPFKENTQAEGSEHNINEIDAVATKKVEQGDLVETVEMSGTISYGEASVAPIAIQGIVTRRHEKGTIIQPGEPLIWIENKPIYLADGELPMYRELRYEKDAKGAVQTGEDIRQLQQFLTDQGATGKGRLKVDGRFTNSTKRAVKAWQKAAGLEQTGMVDSGQIIFQPTPLRIESTPTLGLGFSELSVTPGVPFVNVTLDPQTSASLSEKDQVSIELDDGQISDIQNTSSETQEQKVVVTINPLAALPPETQKVRLIATKVQAQGVLSVPASALIAVAGGGYVVEVKTPAGVEVRQVELGASAQDRIEIQGDLRQGDDVVTPIGLGDGL